MGNANVVSVGKQQQKSMIDAVRGYPVVRRQLQFRTFKLMEAVKPLIWSYPSVCCRNTNISPPLFIFSSDATL